MAVSASFYANCFVKAFNKEIDLDTDTIKAALVASTYTPDLIAHDYFNDITNEVTGTGYTAGGATVGTKTVTVTAANSWGTSRANSTAYALGAIVRPATGNGFVYMATTAGTSGASIPTYPTTVGSTVTDGSVVWTNMGKGVFVFDAADVSWGSSTVTARYCVLYVSTGTSTTSALIALVDFGADVSSTSGTFSEVWDANGICVIFF